MNFAEKRLADTATRLKQLYTAAVYDIMDEMGLPQSVPRPRHQADRPEDADRRSGLHHRQRADPRSDGEYDNFPEV